MGTPTLEAGKTGGRRRLLHGARAGDNRLLCPSCFHVGPVCFMSASRSLFQVFSRPASPPLALWVPSQGLPGDADSCQFSECVANPPPSFLFLSHLLQIFCPFIVGNHFQPVESEDPPQAALKVFILKLS